MHRVREQIISILRGGEKSFWEILASQDYSIKEVVEEIKKLIEEEVIVVNSRNKKIYLKENQDGEEKENYTCPKCEGKGKLLKGDYGKALEEFLKVTSSRPYPIPEFDQGIIAPCDLAHKALFMEERGDLVDKKILILGDDDLFSIYLGLLGKAKEVVVLEIDERIVEFIKKISQERGMGIKTVTFNLANPLPESLKEKFHVFVSEPPESLAGLKEFIKRGAEGIREGGSGYVGLSTLESSLVKWREIEKFILDKNLVITDVLRNFSHYPEKDADWEKFYSHFRLFQELPFDPGPLDQDWYTSSLLRLLKVKERKIKLSQDLYMDEETWATPSHFSA